MAREYTFKMFMFDNDSTIFNHSLGYIEESVFETLEQLKSKGYLLCLNTSRSKDECFNIPKRLFDLMDVVVLLGGAYIINKSDIEIIEMDKNKVRKLIDYFDDHDVTYRYVNKDGISYLNRHNDDKEEIFKRLYDMVPTIKKYEDEKVIHLLYYAVNDTKQEIIKLCEGLSHSHLRRGGEIAPEGTGKQYGLKRVCELYNIEPQEVCAFGDSGNDIEMLKAAGLGIAMGNGTLECKQAADYVTDDISDRGIYNALKYFNII